MSPALLTLPASIGIIYTQPPPDADPMLARATETLTNEQVSRFAKEGFAIGIEAYHTYRSDRSAPGFPDWCIQAGDRTYYLELKGWQPSKKRLNGPTRDQIRWMVKLANNPHNVVRLVYGWQWPDLHKEIWTYQWNWNLAPKEAI
jgi:hypothetical protein